MSRISLAVLTLAACGIVLSLVELVLPHSGVRKTAKAAIGILFLKIMADQIIGIMQ